MSAPHRYTADTDDGASIEVMREQRAGDRVPDLIHIGIESTASGADWTVTMEEAKHIAAGILAVLE